MKIRYISSLLVMLALLSNCTNLSRLQYNDNSNAGSAYNQALAAEYLLYAQNKAQVGDWYDSEYFAKKGLKASKNQQLQLETISTWGLSAEQAKSLNWSRERLEKAFANKSLKEKHPKLAARAFVLFDCWVEQQENGFIVFGENDCKKDFLNTITEIETKTSKRANRRKVVTQKVAPPKTAKPVKQAAPAAPKEEPKQKQLIESKYTVYFPFASDKLDDLGGTVINHAAKKAKGLHDYKIELHGHTDTVGSQEYNMSLSKQRATAVSKMFERIGVVINNNNIKAFGETKPAVTTKDNVANQRNRRVEINVEGLKK